MTMAGLYILKRMNSAVPSNFMLKPSWPPRSGFGAGTTWTGLGDPWKCRGVLVAVGSAGVGLAEAVGTNV